MEISGGSYTYIQLRYSFPDVNNMRSVSLQISCTFVMWSVGPTRFKENTKTNLPSSRTPLCNENPDILRQSPQPAQGGQPSAGYPRPTVGSPWPAVGLSGLAFLIQFNSISWSDQLFRTFIYHHSPLVDTDWCACTVLYNLHCTLYSAMQCNEHCTLYFTLLCKIHCIAACYV